MLDEFYKQKIQQIHIVGEYANLMVQNYFAALQFVQDYFQMDFRRFISKYFRGERAKEINRNITPQKYHQLFGELSDIQSKIINDNESKYIVVAAGPGSGKTRVLVHKLASLLLLEDVKHEQLLMLTFSRAAATEFKKRLLGLIGNAANFVEIKTFHSYCFDLLGTVLNDEVRRKLYVALTRAKDSLYINCNSNLFDHYTSAGVVQKTDTSEYHEPNEILIQLTHKDVMLNFFKGKKEVILNMRSGDALAVSGIYLTTEVNGRAIAVAKFSKAFQEKLDLLASQGYKPYTATVSYVVAWQGENDKEESAIVLPMLSLRK